MSAAVPPSIPPLMPTPEMVAAGVEALANAQFDMATYSEIVEEIFVAMISKGSHSGFSEQLLANLKTLEGWQEIQDFHLRLATKHENT